MIIANLGDVQVPVRSFPPLKFAFAVGFAGKLVIAGSTVESVDTTAVTPVMVDALKTMFELFESPKTEQPTKSGVDTPYVEQRFELYSMAAVFRQTGNGTMGHISSLC